MASSALLIDWPHVTAEEAAGGLRLLSSQSSVVVAGTLVDPARPDFAPMVDGLEGRPVIKLSREELAKLLPLVTLATFGEPGQMALGSAQDSGGGPWMPAAIQVGPRGAASPMVVLALTLTVLDRWLVDHAPSFTTMEIVDADGRVVASSQWHQKVSSLAPERMAAVRAGLELATSSSEQLALAKVPGKLGLTAVTSIELDEARRPIRSLRRSVLGGMGATVLLLVIVSIFFTRWLASRLEQLGALAEAFARGDLSQRAELTGGDELTALGKTFNAMGAELESSRARLQQWNDELKRKVDEATADLRAAQAHLLEAQKLAAIGQLGAGVAHEINNPLVGILGNAQLLLMDTKETDDNFSLLKSIEDSAHRCREITLQLLRFSQKRGEVSLAPMDLALVVRDALELEKERSPGVTLEVVVPSTPVMVDGDSEQLEQVVAQLCTNARTAMLASPTRNLSVTVEATREGATLSVADTGKGIKPENLTRIFEPFFTTKDVWTNIGLGLAVAYRVVQEHQGRLEVHSEPGKGARFVISLKGVGTTSRAASTATTDVGGQGKGITG